MRTYKELEQIAHYIMARMTQEEKDSYPTMEEHERKEVFINAISRN